MNSGEKKCCKRENYRLEATMSFQRNQIIEHQRKRYLFDERNGCFIDLVGFMKVKIENYNAERNNTKSDSQLSQRQF